MKHGNTISCLCQQGYKGEFCETSARRKLHHEEIHHFDNWNSKLEIHFQLLKCIPNKVSRSNSDSVEKVFFFQFRF